MSLREQIVQSLKEYREIVLKGGINCIPSKFTRFRSEFVGIRKQHYYLISGSSKAGKTQFTTFMFIITPIMYYLEHPDQMKPTIMYFPLEETKDDIMLRIYSYIIGYLTNWKILISPEDLQSVDERNPLPIEVINIMESEEFDKIAKAFEDNIIFCTSRNPTGIWKEIKAYLKEHGTEIFEDIDVTYKDDFGNVVHDTIKKLKQYIPNNPNEYVIPIIDHIGLLSVERNMTIKSTIEKLSEYFVSLRNNYYISPVVLQQQNKESNSLEAFKLNKIRPIKEGLKEASKTGEDRQKVTFLTLLI